MNGCNCTAGSRTAHSQDPGRYPDGGAVVVRRSHYPADPLDCALDERERGWVFDDQPNLPPIEAFTNRPDGVCVTNRDIAVEGALAVAKFDEPEVGDAERWRDVDQFLHPAVIAGGRLIRLWPSRMPEVPV